MKQLIHKVNAVKCGKCEKILDIKSDTFMTIYGNICIGTSGGLVGNNLDENMKVENASIYCIPCFHEVTSLVGRR